MSIKVFFTVAILFTAPVLYSQGNMNFNKDNFPAQKNELKEARKNLTKGDIQFENEKYKTALKYYLKANAFNPNDGKLNYKIGQCYFYSDNDSAEQFFLKSMELDKNPGLDNNLYLGTIYHQNAQFDAAINKYKAFIDDLSQREETKDKNKLDKINKLIKECESGKEIVTKSSEIKIEDLSKKIAGAERQYSDYAVYSTSDDSLLYFTSIREQFTKKGHPKEIAAEDIYCSVKQDGRRGMAQNIGKPVNTHANDAIVGLSGDGLTMYIYSNSNNGDIYYSHKNGESWSEPYVFSSQINSGATESSLAFSSTGDTLFFVSNRPGTYGGNDIFYSVKENNDWSSPVNLGPVINTKYDEEAVFVDGDTLYFASKGHNTMGGYDIFKSHKITDNQWSTPENLLSPINSPFDDIFYSSNKYSIYFTSNRNSQSSIYCIEKIIPKKEKIIAVADSTIVPIGDFFIVRDIEFAYESCINTDVYPMLDSLANYLTQNPEAKIRISGYTDTQGYKYYNTKLSVKRANFVKDYLLKKGVKEQNLISEGNGWTKQISKNKDEKGKFIRESLGYNRRVEFEVINQGTPKLIVQKIDVPDSFKIATENAMHPDIYSILLIVSDNEIVDIHTKIKDYNLYKGTDLKYYYYTGKFENLSNAQKRKNELITWFPGVKIFIHKFKITNEKGQIVYDAMQVD